MGSFLVQFALFEHSHRFAGAVLSAAVDNVGPLRLIGIAATRVERYRLGQAWPQQALECNEFWGFQQTVSTQPHGF
jgi:hypothetical protein